MGRTRYTLSFAAAAVLLTASTADATADLSGQWVGNSQLDGSHGVDRTTLLLGAADAADSTLRLEAGGTCTLKHGSWSADANDALSLTFRDASGGEACDRLARGRFTIVPGARPRTVRFEVAYPAADGSQSVRRGSLARYP